MASAMFFSRIGGSGGCMELPADKGHVNFNHHVALSRQLLPNDARGVFLLTLQNVVIGSRWQIETVAAKGSAVDSGVAASNTVQITLKSYTVDNSLNNLVIKVRNSSIAPFYQAFETRVTARAGADSIYVNQIRDDN